MSIETRAIENKKLRIELGKKLVDYMRDHQLTQDEVARRSGVSRNMVNILINVRNTDDLIQPKKVGKLNSMFRGEYGRKARGTERDTKI